jgi:hypothetical protein
LFIFAVISIIVLIFALSYRLIVEASGIAENIKQNNIHKEYFSNRVDYFNQNK